MVVSRHWPTFRQRFELDDIVDRGTHRSIRLTFHDDLNQDGYPPLLTDADGPLQSRLDLLGSVDAAAHGPHRFHDRHVIHAVGFAVWISIGEIHREVHLVRQLGLANQAHVAVVHHDEHVGYLVLDGHRYLLHQKLEGVVSHDAHHQLIGPGGWASFTPMHAGTSHPSGPACPQQK